MRPGVVTVEHPAIKYGLTLAAVAVALAARWLLDPLMGDHVPFATFFVAIAAAAWLGGLRPGLLATVLGFVLSLYFFVPPRYSVVGTSGPHFVGLAMYVTCGLAIATFGEAMRVAQRRFAELVRQHEGPVPPPFGSADAILRKHHLRDAVVVGFSVVLAVMLVGGGTGYVNARQLNDNRKWVGHTHEVIGSLEALLSTLKDAETGQRGYLLAEDEKYLQPYDDAVNQVKNNLARLKELTSDNPDQQDRLAMLEKKVGDRLDELHQTVALMKKGDRAATLKVVRSGTGKALMDDVRRETATMQQVEHDLLKKRADESEASYLATVWSILLPSGIGSVLVCVVFYLTQRSIQQRQQAALVLAEQKERLRTTLSSIGDGVISTDGSGNVTYLNAVAESLTGWRNVEAAGVPLTQVFRIVNESTRLPVGNPATRALKEGVIVGLANHTLLIAKDGTERPIDDSAAPIRCSDGEIVGCVLVFRDISGRYLAETAQREARQQIATTLESVTDGFMRYDRDWRIVYVNAEAERINRLTRSETLGRIVWEVFPSLAGTKFEAEFRRAVAERVTVEFENHYEPFGRWYSLKGYPTADGGLTSFIRDITEQKRFEQRLLESEARYRAIGESIDYGVWVCDSEGRNTYASESFLRMVGITQEQCSNFGWGDALHPDDIEATISAWKECVQTQGRWDRVHRFKGVDGQWRHVLARGVPLRDPTGQSLGWAGINLDISRMMETEQEVVRIAAESERQRRLYETVLSSTPDFVYVFSLDHKVLYANEALIKMWGRGHDGAIGKTFLEIGYEPWHAEMHDREIDQVRATRQPIRGEVPFTGTHGQRQYDYIFVPVIGADGEVEAVAGTTRDVTDRKEAERAIRASEERRRLALDAAELGAWHIDLATNTFTTDERFRIIFAGTTEAMDYEQAVSAIHADDRGRILEAVAAATRSDDPAPYAEEYRVLHPDGSVRWVFAKGRTNYDREETGRLVSFDGTVADITDRKQIEEERERLVGQLRDADCRKDEFLATLAHELRNPLAPIRNGLQVLRLAKGNGEAVEQSRSMMERQLEQMVRLVDDLMDVSRISRGKLELKKERVQLAGVLNSAVETSRPLIDQMGHELTVTLPSHSVVVDADLTRLAQVFLNLLNNAAKYSDPGGHIRLSAERQGSDVVVSVRDTGIGITADQLPRIFEMFSQVDRSLEKSQGGLGIGLSLVKRLVELHGGGIEAKSEGAGKGSEFVVRLPVIVEASVPPTTEETKDGDVKSTLRILIVDDNRDNADSLSMMLKIMGNDTRTSYDGEEAVAVTGQFRPDVILLDIGLPKLNGYEACRRIRAHEGGQRVVVIAQTGWGQDEDRQRTHEAGFDHHMVKPVDPNALMTLLAGLSKAVRQ